MNCIWRLKSLKEELLKTQEVEEEEYWEWLEQEYQAYKETVEDILASTR